MASDSATALVTQQSIKAYVDAQITLQDIDYQGDTGGAQTVDLDSQTLTFAGGTGIDTSGSGQTLTIAIDSTVATLSGTQTLTNKTLTSPKLNDSTAITTTGTEINKLDGDTTASAVVVVDADQLIINDDGSIKQIAVTRLDTYFSGTTATLTNKTLTAPVLNNVDINGGDISSATVINKSPVITLAGDLSGSVTLTELGNGTLTATISANSVALGTDTTGNYVSEVSAGEGIDVSGSG